MYRAPTTEAETGRAENDGKGFDAEGNRDTEFTEKREEKDGAKFVSGPVCSGAACCTTTKEAETAHRKLAKTQRWKTDPSLRSG
jgi:hypothetical protein